MPELSRFGGMVIYMLFGDIKHHNKPHVHVYYGDYEASIGIDGELLGGSLPRKQFKMVLCTMRKKHTRLGIRRLKGSILKKSLQCEVC